MDVVVHQTVVFTPMQTTQTVLAAVVNLTYSAVALRAEKKGTNMASPYDPIYQNTLSNLGSSNRGY